MRQHARNYIGLALLAFAAGGCTNEHTPGEEEVKTKGTPLTIQAAIRSTAAAVAASDVDESAYKAFPAGKQIHIYYAHNNLEQAYDFMQGLYEAPADGNKTTSWTAKPWQPAPGAEPVESIYVEDIKAPNSDGQYFFTATSYPEPRVAGTSECVYEVAADQTALAAGFGPYDFLAARAIYPDDSWKDPAKGITLHFRHLLSQLRVQLILPEGKTDDGFFPAPKDAVITATLNGKRHQYTVTYNNRTPTAGIFGIGIPQAGGEADLKMRFDGVTGPVTVNNKRSYCHTFSAILPKQTLYGGKQLAFTIDGVAYSYTPPAANTVLLEQEKITTIQLTVLSGPGNQKVMLNKVEQTEWVEDRADVGDLIPQ